MKSKGYISLVMVLLLVCLAFGWYAGRTRGGDKVSEAHPFTISQSGEDWIIVLPDEVGVIVGPSNRLDVTVSVHGSINLRYGGGEMRDRLVSDRMITNIVLDIPPRDWHPGAWVSDLNADGIPDRMRIKGAQGHLYFFEGSWRKYVGPYGDRKTFLIDVDGEDRRVMFDRRGLVEYAE
jgi:hypothetical protein